MPAYPHVNRANAYARAVKAGRKPANKWVKLACERHLRDLDAAKDKGYPYVFDRAAANRACSFTEKLHHTKGRWASKRERIVLEPWQQFILCSLFGWKVRQTGFRRYREAFILVPRKNGKSLLAAAVGLYMFAADGEYGAEVYSGATTEKQAWEVFRPARLMAQKQDALREHFNIAVNAKALSISDDGSRFEPIIGDPGDGSSPSCAIVDEYHEHADDRLYSTMVTGMGSRDQPLMFVISTAGSNLAGPCYEMQANVQKMLDGVVVDDQLFGLVYGVDEGDDWTAEASLIKANPNYGVSVSGEYLQAQIQKAINSPAKQNVTKTKHLNVWVGAREAWLNMEQWHRCGDQSLKREDFYHLPSVVGIDLATRTDIAALVQVFYTIGDDGKTHYYAFPDLFIPESALEYSKNANVYAGWAADNLLHIVDADEIDYGAIQELIVGEGGMVHRSDIRELAYDPWQATQLAQECSKQGATAVEVRNTVVTMNPAMREMEAAIASGRFHHPASAPFTWMASNVVAKADGKDNIFPRKDQPEQKIDGIVACLMAIGRAYYAAPVDSIYETEELLVL